MMHDRFAAQLRQHLLETVGERPADGQLAAVVERVAVTEQRHPLAARLAWFPGRIGPFPSATLRYGLIALALVGGTVAATMLGGGIGPTRSTVFEGTWTSTDPADNSTQTLVVAAGTSPALHYEDDFASGAACRADAVKVFTAEGAGEVSGNRLAVSYPEGGGCGLMKVPVPGASYDYDAGSDTLLDYQDVRWVRVQGGAGPATQRPAAQPTRMQPTETQPPTSLPPLASATPVADCIEFKGGGTYSGSAGSLSLTVTLPAAADSWWHGLRDTFYLLKAPCLFGGPVRLETTLVSHVYADPCDWRGTEVEVGTSAAAADALAAQGGHDTIGPTGAIIAGYAARRFEISVPADSMRRRAPMGPSSCGQLPKVRTALR